MPITQFAMQLRTAAMRLIDSIRQYGAMVRAPTNKRPGSADAQTRPEK